MLVGPIDANLQNSQELSLFLLTVLSGSSNIAFGAVDPRFTDNVVVTGFSSPTEQLYSQVTFSLHGLYFGIVSNADVTCTQRASHLVPSAINTGLAEA